SRLAGMALNLAPAGKADERAAEVVALTRRKEDLNSVRGNRLDDVDFLVYRHITPDPKKKTEFEREERLLAFVLRPGQKMLQRVELGPVEPIAKAVERFRSNVVRKQGPSQKPDDPGQVLRRLVWVPLEKHFAGATQVLLAPDGALTTLPFAAL